MQTTCRSSHHGGSLPPPPEQAPPGQIPSTSPLGVGLDHIPLNFPLGCGPGPDPPQLPPWVWAWRPPSQIPLTSPLGVGLETCKACWDTTPLETCCKACWDTTCNACWDSTISPPSLTDRHVKTRNYLVLTPYLEAGWAQ